MIRSLKIYNASFQEKDLAPNSPKNQLFYCLGKIDICTGNKIAGKRKDMNYKKRELKKIYVEMSLSYKPSLPNVSLRRGKIHPMNVLYMTLIILMVRLQSWGSWECGVPLAITPGFTLTWTGSTCYGPIYGSNRTD